MNTMRYSTAGPTPQIPRLPAGRSSVLTLFSILVLGSGCLVEAAPKQNGAAGGGVVKPRPNHATLAETQKRSQAGRKTANTGQPAKLVNPQRAQSGSLFEDSAVLSHDGTWSFVPRGAVVHVPTGYADRVNGKREGTLLPWPVFYQKHRTWIHLHKVTMNQAQGKTPLPEDNAERFRTLGQVVVAVNGVNPIAVKSPKQGQETAATGRPEVK